MSQHGMDHYQTEKSSSRRLHSYRLTKEQEKIRCSEHTSATAPAELQQPQQSCNSRTSHPALGVCRGRDRRPQPLPLCPATSSSLAGTTRSSSPRRFHIGGFESLDFEKSRVLQEGRLASALPCQGVLLHRVLLWFSCAWCFFAGKLTKTPGLLPPWPKWGCAQSSPRLSCEMEQGNMATSSGHHFGPPTVCWIISFLTSSLLFLPLVSYLIKVPLCEIRQLL